MKQPQPVTEAEILKEVLGPSRDALNPEAARSILALHFSRPATARIRSILRANHRGRLCDTDRIELERYLSVGQLLDLLQARARLALAASKAA